MKIFRITSVFPPPWQGLAPGPYGLSMAQARRGEDLTVITKAAGETSTFDWQLPFKVSRIKAPSDFLFSLKAALKVRNRVQEEKIDIIHAHGFSAFWVLMLRKIRFLNVPVVVSVHILRDKQYKKNKLRERWVLFQEKIVFRWADAICAVSDDIAEAALCQIKQDAIVRTVYNGVNIEHFLPEIKHKRAGSLKILFVGVLNGRKGENDLIEACFLLFKTGIDFELKIVGDGDNRQSLEKSIKAHGMINKVKFESKVDYAYMPNLYKQADIFVLPSYSEGMPKVLLEAMACGLPVIVTDIPGCRELVEEGKNGYLVPTGNPELLAQAMRQLAEEPKQIVEMGRECRRIIENNYTWDTVANRVDCCYQAVFTKLC